MENSICLSNKSCVPCHGSIPPLAQQEANHLLLQLGNSWSINKQGHLYKSYLFDDFMGAIHFANQIAVLAEQEGHHPDLALGWGKCAVEIWTHKINGLTESDFILASKIEAIFLKIKIKD